MVILWVFEVQAVQPLKICTFIEIQKHIEIFGYCIRNGIQICKVRLSCRDQFLLTTHWNFSRIRRILKGFMIVQLNRQYYTIGIWLYIQELFPEIVSMNSPLIFWVETCYWIWYQKGAAKILVGFQVVVNILGHVYLLR